MQNSRLKMVKAYGALSQNVNKADFLESLGLSDIEKMAVDYYLNEKQLDMYEFLKSRKLFYIILAKKDIFNISASVAAGIVLNSYAHYEEGQRDYLEAFFNNIKSASYLDKAVKCFCSNIEEFNDIAFAKKWGFCYQDSEFQWTVNMWENAKKSPIPSNELNDIADALQNLELLYSEEGDTTVGIQDIKGNTFYEYNYFDEQTGFIKSETDFNEKYESALKKIFKDNWVLLLGKTRNALLEAELKYYKSEVIGSDLESIATDYKKAIERELLYILIHHKDIKDIRDEIGKIYNKPTTGLSIREIINSFKQSHIKKLLENAHFPLEIYEESILNNLGEINYARNCDQHEFRPPDFMKKRREEFRTIVLGNESKPGYLPMLMDFKKKLKEQNLII